MKRLFGALLALILLLCALAGTAAGEGGIPAALQFTQTTEQTNLSGNRRLFITLPHTALPAVDAQIEGLVDEMVREAMPFMPGKSVDGYQETRLDVGPYVTRVGKSWMSFLTVARIAHMSEQIYVAFDARVYDMETGEPVPLTDVIDSEKGGWAYLSAEAKAQLAAHFPKLAADPDRLEALCAEEALADAAFTLSPGHLSLIFSAEDLYDGAPAGLLRVTVYYPELKPYMTEKAIAGTDCSGYALVALTYDDGPVRGSSDRLMNQLRLYGAEATFFAVGTNMARSAWVLSRAYDAGYSVQSHNWVHQYTGVNGDSVAKWKAKMDEGMSDIIGVAPVLMRAPGGNEAMFIRAGMGLPMIHWSRISGDASKNEDDRNNVRAIGSQVGSSHDGDIVLCHDLNPKCADFAAVYLPRLEERGFLLVTVQDLCVLRGVVLTPDMILSDCPR